MPSQKHLQKRNRWIASIKGKLSYFCISHDVHTSCEGCFSDSQSVAGRVACGSMRSNWDSFSKFFACAKR